jgi:pyruvate,water dikinase
MNNMEKGQILVSQTTDPELMPALRKASAIVTDLGGMLSHSAISARELDIPCIIATGNATKVLKDGMEVEVDANSGIVRILDSN